ncbi:MAG: cytochrome P450 [Bryobacteraceae bacterium]
MAAAVLPPGPKGRPFVGVFAGFRKDPPLFLLNVARQYGDVAFFTMGRQEFYLLNRPEYVQDILVTHSGKFQKSRIMQRSKILLGEGLLTSEGQLHLRQRRLVQPAFHRQRIAGYAAAMVEAAGRAAGRWTDGETRDISEEMMRLTLTIVAETLFGATVEEDADEIGRAITDVLGMFNMMLIPFTEFLQKMPLPSMRRFERARSFLDRKIYSIINERRESGDDRGDLLSMLLLAQDEQGDGGSMTDTQVRDEALTLFMAGHETTANALTWTWYLLSQNPEAEERLHEELRTVLSGRAPVFDDLPRLAYTEMVFAESMRLYPPAWAVSRLAMRDHDVAGYHMPAGCLCLMSPFVMHRNPEFFPDPERFDPERWTPEAKEQRPKFSYYPFGGGPRICIGERFAWTEGVLLLAAIAQKWQMRLDPEQQVAHRAQITLRTRYGMRMRLTER